MARGVLSTSNLMLPPRNFKFKIKNFDVNMNKEKSPWAKRQGCTSESERTPGSSVNVYSAPRVCDLGSSPHAVVQHAQEPACAAS